MCTIPPVYYSACNTPNLHTHGIPRRVFPVFVQADQMISLAVVPCWLCVVSSPFSQKQHHCSQAACAWRVLGLCVQMDVVVVGCGVVLALAVCSGGQACGVVYLVQQGAHHRCSLLLLVPLVLQLLVQLVDCHPFVVQVARRRRYLTCFALVYRQCWPNDCTRSRLLLLLATLTCCCCNYNAATTIYHNFNTKWFV